ncbi:MAG: 2TM domain-containing protein [Hyphomicrobium sp.]
MEKIRSEEEKYIAAKAHVAALKGFYIHLTVFVAVMTGLIGADYAGGGSWWVQWPLIGWGLGVLGHAYLVFSPANTAASTWEERKIKETMAKMQ